MSIVRHLKCDAKGCAATFDMGGVPEEIARNDAAEAGWLQLQQRKPSHTNRVDFCPEHAPKVSAKDLGL